MENVVLFGNGLNLLSDNKLSWQNLLDAILNEDLGNEDSFIYVPSELPNTLQYDFVLFNSDVVEKSIIEYRQLKLKECIAEKVGKFPTNDIYKRLCELKIDTYLTTNYDHTFDEALKRIGYVQNLEEGNNQEKLYNIRRLRVFEKGTDTKKVYPRHGDIKNPKSIVIGYNHYCGTLGKLDAYLKGRTKLKDSDESPSPKMEDRLVSDNIKIERWIDYFFFSNVYIIGFGLDFSEIDIWWILDRRKRLIMQGYPIKNRIAFYDIVEKDVSLYNDKDLSHKELTVKAKYEILEKMSVDHCVYEVENDDYHSSYKKVIDDIEKCCKHSS